MISLITKLFAALFGLLLTVFVGCVALTVLHTMRGGERSAAGDNHGAIEEYNRAIQVNPWVAESYANRGASKQRSGDYDGALTDYQTALGIKPADPSMAFVYYNRALIYQERRNHSAAQSDLDWAIKLQPDNAEAYNRRGFSRKSLGNKQGSLADYDRAIALQPQKAAFFNGRAYARLNFGDKDGAVADFSRQIELQPDEMAGYFGRAFARQAKRDFDGAIVDEDHVLETSPKRADALGIRGNLKFGKKDLAGALEDYNRAIELDPNEAETYEHRARVEHLQGRHDAALADFDHAIKLAPDDGHLYALRAVTKRAVGDTEGAFADYNLCIENDSSFAGGLRGRALLNMYRGEWTDALYDFRRYCETAEEKLDYAHLLIWFIRCRLGEVRAADRELAAYFDGQAEEGHKDWSSRLIEHLLNKRTEDDLLAAAASPDPVKNQEQFCEAWCYAGMKRLFTGDKAGAAAAFSKCLATEKKSFVEYELAEGELKVLGLPSTPPTLAPAIKPRRR